MRAAALLAIVLLAGCADASSQRAPSRAWTLTPLGTPLLLPSWVAPEFHAEVMAEVDAALVPAGWSVVVTVPIFEAPASPTGLARGLCDYDARTLTVGWRVKACEDRPLLPALLHEVGHIHGGPEAGH